ncbi:DUF397 domain-containing protein [Kitasatospora sp. NBC_01287]|uniref:DUF397 domain-containing protein n=1 Tax=Kitasatospora sp. NBC_01287 TaxID=2903573 RepID=UPI00225A88EC|nr:DUF397 domain-containing protein [Kitasatospora sp. NBC_01287]MCX4747242.1 DUF397 domain-containing protein [Kitasatospora sp. NBC_01287]
MGPATPDLSAVAWRKSSYSSTGQDNCVEIADGLPGILPVRDSKDPAGPALVFPAASFAAFLAGVKHGALT